MNYYTSYGLQIFSYEPLLNLPSLKSASNSIKLNFILDKNKPIVPDYNYKKQIKYIIPDLETAELFILNDFFYINFIHRNTWGSYIINKEKNIVDIRYYPEINKKEFISLFYQPIMSYLARLNQKTCLHANVLYKNNKAFAFMGNSGVGKSTLSVYLWKKGLKLLSDDVCVLSNKNYSSFEAWQGQQRFKLYSEIANLIDKDRIQETVFNNDYSKVYFNSKNKEFVEKVELNTIYYLKSRIKNIEAPIIKTLKKDEAFQILLSNSIVKEIMSKEDIINEFKFLSELSKNIKIKEVIIPDSIELLDYSTNILLEDILIS